MSFKVSDLEKVVLKLKEYKVDRIEFYLRPGLNIHLMVKDENSLISSICMFEHFKAEDKEEPPLITFQERIF